MYDVVIKNLILFMLLLNWFWQ